MAIEVTDANFEELVIKATTPVLLDFYADWCGPCKILGPIINELAQEYEGRVLVAKVDTEINPRLSQYFSILYEIIVKKLQHNVYKERTPHVKSKKIKW